MTALIKKFRVKSYKRIKPIVSLKNVSLSYGKGHRVLDSINLEIPKNSIVGLLGPNGAGKSSIMNLILGSVSPSYGNIYIRGINATNYPIYERTTKFKLAIVPQRGGFFYDLDVESNLKAVGELVVPDEKERLSRIDQLIAKFELDSVRKVLGRHLSGGMARKLVIAMGLLRKPELLLLDEPLAALDLQSIAMLQSIICNLQTQSNITILITDHQAASILSVVDSALILSNTKIVAQGSPQAVLANPRAVSYFGKGFKLNQ